MQKTVAQDIQIDGVGLHSGAAVRLVIKPAPADHGLIFHRVDVDESKKIVHARWDQVTDTRLCTLLENEYGVSVGTVEHLMAALCALGIDNAVMELNGPEVPILDGSSAQFMDHIIKGGIDVLEAPRRTIRVLKEIRVEQDGKIAVLSPSTVPTYKGMIDFDHPDIGQQSYEIQLVNGNFAHELSEARTFGFEREVEQLRAMGLARGGSLENAIVLGEDKVLNPDGLRFKDEFIRHKLLDAVGDLYLAGAPLQAAYYGEKAGHAMNNAVLHALFADETAWDYV